LVAIMPCALGCSASSCSNAGCSASVRVVSVSRSASCCAAGLQRLRCRPVAGHLAQHVVELGVRLGSEGRRGREQLVARRYEHRIVLAVGIEDREQTPFRLAESVAELRERGVDRLVEHRHLGARREELALRFDLACDLVHAEVREHDRVAGGDPSHRRHRDRRGDLAVVRQPFVQHRAARRDRALIVGLERHARRQLEHGLPLRGLHRVGARRVGVRRSVVVVVVRTVADVVVRGVVGAGPGGAVVVTDGAVRAVVVGTVRVVRSRRRCVSAGRERREHDRARPRSSESSHSPSPGPARGHA
jgi:hypothetical protein